MKGWVETRTEEQHEKEASLSTTDEADFDLDVFALVDDGNLVLSRVVLNFRRTARSN
jgi:hypothetical protein